MATLYHPRASQQAIQGQPQLQHICSQEPQALSNQLCSASPVSYVSGPQQAMTVHHEPQMALYIWYVKTLYQQSVVEKKLNAIKWPPTPSTVYINLVCVDQTTRISKEEADECTRAMIRDGSVDVILKKKKPIDFSDIAKDVPLSERKVILVEGAPGVGKSTLAWEFCRRWERGEIAQQYRLVLLLRLRDKVMIKAQCLSDLLHHPSEAIVQAVENELIATLGANTLIILEGFDELPSACRTEPSVFLRLINGELPHATVLVTSRPWATQDLHRQCSHRIFQHIEILGFTGKQIEEYVASVFMNEKKPASDKARENIEEVMSYIKTYPQIKACMYIPLNSAIVVSVYQESKAGKCILPKTVTELYYALVQTLLLRYLYGHPKHGQKNWEIQSLTEDLPHEVYSKVLALSELAYSGICTDKKGSVQLIYSNLPQGFETLGLMQSVPQLYVTQGVVMSHNFLHLTVQEFLAALHISNMPPEQQLEHFQTQGKEGRWRVVLRFLAGLTQLANLSSEFEVLRGLLLRNSNEDHIELENHPIPLWDPYEHQSTEWDRYSITADVKLTSEHAHWMFETQKDNLVPLVLQEKMVEFRCEEWLTPLDYYSLGYCICHSNSHWVLTVVEAYERQKEVLGEEDVRMLVAGVNTRCDTSARVVGLRGCNKDFNTGGGYCPPSISAEALDVFFIELKNVIHLQELHLNLPVECCSIPWPNLSGIRVLCLAINDKRNWRLDTLLPHLSLECLVIMASSVEGGLGLNDVVSIGELLLSSNCPKNVDITDKKSSIEVAVCQEVHEKQFYYTTPLVKEEESVEHIRCRLDWYSLGYVIAHSNFQWVLRVAKLGVIEAEEVRMLVAGADTRRGTSARVVGLRDREANDLVYGGYCPLFKSAEALNVLFNELKYVIHLQELHLELPAECCSIPWPKLSGLRILHLAISGERNWRLDTLLPHLSLEVLTILITKYGGLGPDDVASIGELFLSSNCPKLVDIADLKSCITAEVALDQEVHEEQFENRTSLVKKKRSVEFIRCRLDWLPLGYVISHSRFQWVLTMEKARGEKEVIGEEEVRMLVAGINSRCDTSARVVGLRGQRMDSIVHTYHPLSMSAEALNLLFIKLESVLHLQNLHLNLPAECCSIAWPDLSGLRLLHLRMKDKRNWRLDTLLPHLSLKSLIIESTRDGGTVVLEDCVALGMLLSSSGCLKFFYLGNVTIDAHGMQPISKAMSDNQMLPLATLVVENCTLHGTAAHSLAMFVANSTTLHHLTILRCTLRAHGLLELAQAIHHSSSLQERKLEDLTCTVDGDDEVTGLLSVEYHFMRDCLGELFASHISDRVVQAIATALGHNSSLMRLDLSNSSISNTGLAALSQALHHNSTLERLDLSDNNISDTGLDILAQSLHHNSTLVELNLSNNSISDSGAIALAQALHHHSTLKWLGLSNNSIGDSGSGALAKPLHRNIMKLDLSGNGAISAVGTHQLVQALTAYTKFSSRLVHSFIPSLRTFSDVHVPGLVLPRRCEEYATQCPQYSQVKDSIRFL